MDDATKALLILAAVVLVFLWNKLPLGLVAVLTSLALWATGLVDAQTVAAGFGDPVVIFLATLYVVSEGIDASGVTAWAGQFIVRKAGTGYRQLLVALGLLCAVLSSFITLNGATAAILPLTLLLAGRIGRSPSHMLMPIVFAGSAGGLLMLMSSPVNVVVSEAADQAGDGPFPFFSFAIVGIPLLIGTVIIGTLLAQRILPDRGAAANAANLGNYAHVIDEHYTVARPFTRVTIEPGSPLAGENPEKLELPTTLTLSGCQSPAARAVTDRLDVGDTLVLAGDQDEARKFAAAQRLAVGISSVHSADDLLTGERGAAEVMIRPRSDSVGDSVYPGQVGGHGLVLIAVRRRGKDLGDAPVRLVEGDLLLLAGEWARLEELTTDPDIVLVDHPEQIRRHAVPWGPGATRSMLVLALLVVMLASGRVPPVIAGLIAAALMVIVDVVTFPKALRAISWETVVLVGGLIPLSVAIQHNGAADKISDVLIDVAGTDRPLLLLIALFALTALLGQFVSNTATVLILVPVALAAAASTGISSKPLLMAVAVAGSASLLTPVATPGNTMIMTPGGYRFGDYWRLGLPIMVWWFLVAIVVIPLVWRF